MWREFVIANETRPDSTGEFDLLLAACSDKERRIVLLSLGNQPRTLTVRDLIHAVAEHKHHSTFSELPAETLEEIQSSLYHIHLPKLEAIGLVWYDSERKLVGPTDYLTDVYSTLLAIISADPSLDALHRD